MVVINKIDRPDARADEVLSEIIDLFIDLGATEEQLEFPVIYAIGRAGIAQAALRDEAEGLDLLFDTIISSVAPPSYSSSEPFQMLVSDLSYSDYFGRQAIGKVINGSVRSKDDLVCIGEDGTKRPLNVSKLQAYAGPKLVESEGAEPGDIVVLSGIDEVHIGDTICTKEYPKALKRIIVDEPTISMRFSVNTSPMAGREGTQVTTSKLLERLRKETLKNVSIQVEETGLAGCYRVKGRGEFQLVILIEMLRREGFELCVGRPEVIYRFEGGKRLEPIERLSVDCGEAFAGVVTERLSARKGRMIAYLAHAGGRVGSSSRCRRGPSSAIATSS